MTWIVLACIVAAAIVLTLFAKVCLGLVVIKEDQVGIISKKFGKPLPNGSIVALNGEAGVQVDVLPPGWHFFYVSWKYAFMKVPLV